MQDARHRSIEAAYVRDRDFDLLTALGPSIRWTTTQRAWDPAAFRALVATWIADHPDEAVALLPEWRTFREILRA